MGKELKEINSSDIMLEGNCLYNKRIIKKFIKKGQKDTEKAILWRIKNADDTV